MTQPATKLVTMALPYANGAIHLGHLVEGIQADIWVRFHKMLGEHIIFVCGNDAHGTPIMLSAEKQGITPEALIEKVHADHATDYANFLVDLDKFYTTHSPENQTLSNYIYVQLTARGDIVSRKIKQAFDVEKNMFLPDRFIKGTCPKCGAPDQYGDNCEVCGATYSPTDLINAVSVVSGTTPIEKESEHYFFCLDHYTDLLKQWIRDSKLQPHVANKLQEWFDEGLQQWDISRDAPYFGFEIPNHPGKYFYVWLDAPVGYMAAFKKLCEERGDLNFDDYWRAESKTELYHFIGKDIVYFHALFWPAMLSGSGFRLPTALFVHGFLTINGLKMSKSRGTFITAKQYAEVLPAEYLRYYYAAKLSANVEDIDLNLEDFKFRINADLVGKVINIASRTAGFITKKFNGQLADKLADEQLFQDFVNAGDAIAAAYQNLNYSHAVREIMALADRANQYVDRHQPWTLAKDENQLPQVQLIATQALNLFKILMTYLKPILPVTAQNAEAFLNCELLSWENRLTPLLNHTINPFKPLLQRITDEQIAALAHHE